MSATVVNDELLRELVAEHLAAAGADDPAARAVAVVERVRLERPHQTGGNDARLWANLIQIMRDAGLVDERERLARQLVAIVRRVREPGRLTWAPGDDLPEVPPRRLFDLDGAMWLRQRHGHGQYRMSAADRRRYGDSSGHYEGDRVWPFLLDDEGPLTAPPTAV